MTTYIEIDVPRGLAHCLSSRPRPAVCSIDTRTAPSPSPARARAARSAFVEPVVSMTATERQSVAAGSIAAMRPASGGLDVTATS